MINIINAIGQTCKRSYVKGDAYKLRDKDGGLLIQPFKN